jgi:superfamily II DNA helicase RecQ
MYSMISAADISAADISAVCSRCMIPLSEMFGQSLKAEQVEIIGDVINDKIVFAVLPTGVGKSECYATLPELFRQVNII